MYRNVFKNKRVLITGHTGFKGTWLAVYLQHLGADVMGYALDPPTTPSLFELVDLRQHINKHVLGNILDQNTLNSKVQEFQPDFVFHLAAQSLVLESYDTPKATFEVNVIGTLSLLEAVRSLNKSCAVVIVSTDKCYENMGWVYGYRETDALGGRDPYSASKAAMEIAVSSYRRSFLTDSSNIRMASARAGNVIGGGDWAKNRIVPDIVRHLQCSKPIEVRNPNAIRPWQHVLEPLSGYLWLAAMLSQDNWEPFAEAWNFGPYVHETYRVLDLVRAMISEWGSGEWVDVSAETTFPEENILRLNIEKAMTRLQWHPTWQFQDAVFHTSNWYSKYPFEHPQDAFELCVRDIELYEQTAIKSRQLWTQ